MNELNSCSLDIARFVCISSFQLIKAFRQMLQFESYHFELNETLTGVYALKNI